MILRTKYYCILFINLQAAAACGTEKNEILPLTAKATKKNIVAVHTDLIPIAQGFALAASCTKTMKPSRSITSTEKQVTENAHQAKKAFLELAHAGKITWCVEEFIDKKLADPYKQKIISEFAASCKANETSSDPKLNFTDRCNTPKTGEQVLIKSSLGGLIKYGRVTIAIKEPSAEQKLALKNGWNMIGLKTSSLGVQRLSEDLVQ